ncbi:MAG: hypothetical protein WCJ30_01775 [Deltaproteobacteria bacterium]
MYTQWTLYVLLSGIAFAVAILSVMKQWLSADMDVATVETGLRRERAENNAAMMASLDGTAGSAMDVPEARSAAAGRTEARDESKPLLIADDENAVARLCFGWGGGGMLVGMLSGAATHGFVGALLGSVILSAASIGVAVVVALVLDRATLKAWNAAHETKTTDQSA